MQTELTQLKVQTKQNIPKGTPNPAFLVRFYLAAPKKSRESSLKIDISGFKTSVQDYGGLTVPKLMISRSGRRQSKADLKMLQGK